MKKQMTIIWLINERLAKKRQLYWTPKQKTMCKLMYKTNEMKMYTRHRRKGNRMMKKQIATAWLINQQIAKKEILDWTPKQHVQVNVQDGKPRAV